MAGREMWHGLAACLRYHRSFRYHPHRRPDRYHLTMSDPAINQVIAAQQSALASQISATILRKQLDAVAVQGDAVNQLLESAARLSHELGKGHMLDLLA